MKGDGIKLLGVDIQQKQKNWKHSKASLKAFYEK